MKVRLRDHYRTGFTSPPIALKPFPTGKEAQDVETLLLRLMKAHQVPTCPSVGLKFDGSTEAFRFQDGDAGFRREFEWTVG